MANESDMECVPAKLTKRIVDEMEEIINQGWYANKSELIRDAIRELIKKQKSQILFVDTDMYVMKVWCEYVFQQCHQYILEQICERKYDLYLLCDVDLPWVQDELREYPEDGPRKELFQIYKDLLINQNVPWVTISGTYEARELSAIEAVKGLMNQ